VAAAERTRKAECGAGNVKRCRARETDEGAARATLAKAIADNAATDRAAKLDADAATVRARLATASPVAYAAADPGAAALASYLATFGVSIPAGLASEWMVLIGVIALELGSALAVVLVRAAGAPHRSAQQSASVDSDAQRAASKPDPKRASRTPAKGRHVGPGQLCLDLPEGRADPSAKVSGQSKGKVPNGQSAIETSGQSNGRKVSGQPSIARRVQTQQRIIAALADSGGRLNAGSVRAIARLTGAKRTAVHSALGALLASGAVAKVGTALVLTAAA
jgi:hypothetical protein